MIEFEVVGSPRALKRHRTGKHGRYDPSAGDKVCFLVLAHKHKPEKPSEGPIELSVEFYFPRPKSHYRTGKYSLLLKEDAPKYHTSTPDVDNLLKFIGDALNGVFWKDDSQICYCEGLKKYSKRPRTIVKVFEL